MKTALKRLFLIFAFGLVLAFPAKVLADSIYFHKATIEAAENFACPENRPIKEITKVESSGREDTKNSGGYTVTCSTPSGTTPLGTISQPGALTRFGTGQGGIAIFVQGFIGLLVVAAVVLSFIFIIIGGISLITAGGDKAKIEAARGRIVWAVVGLAIVFVAFAIIKFVEGIFGVSIISGGFKIPGL